MKLPGPSHGHFFGAAVAVNHAFIVVSGRDPETVYIYASTPPYSLVADIPIGGDDITVYDVAVTTDNDVVLVVYADGVSAVVVYTYDGQGSWHMDKTWMFEGDY